MQRYRHVGPRNHLPTRSFGVFDGQAIVMPGVKLVLTQALLRDAAMLCLGARSPTRIKWDRL
jgi:hypothetical protein